MADETLVFKSSHDVEIGETGIRNCSVKFVRPAGEAQGLAIIIPGFGDDVDDAYNTMLRRQIAGKHGLVAATVDYHCMKARPPAAQIEIEREEFARLVGQIVFAGQPNLINVRDAWGTFKNAVDAGVKFSIYGKLKPPNNEHQNFGLLQAIDHVNAVYALQDAEVKFNPSKVVAIGTSHGGYIAHMIMKIAPNLLSAIVDNSAYTACSPSYIGADFEFWQKYGDGILYLSTYTKWQLKKSNDRAYFGPPQFAIRDLMDPNHLSELRGKSKVPCQVRMLNSVEDEISPIATKQRHQHRLEEAGFDAQLEPITRGHLDGKVLKNLDHGMGAALNMLFDQYYPQFSNGAEETDRELETDLSFNCAHDVYRFRHSRDDARVRFTYKRAS